MAPIIRREFTDSRAFKFPAFSPVTLFVDPLKFDLDLPESDPVNARPRASGRGLSNQDRIALYRERFHDLAREQGFREAVEWLLRVAARRD